MNIPRIMFAAPKSGSGKTIFTSAFINLLNNIIDVSINEQPKCNTLCKFRCAVCGQIYKIDYTREYIKCPLCLSSKIMTNEEAGFLK